MQEECTLEVRCQAWAKDYDCARRKKQAGSFPSDCSSISQHKVGNCYYRTFEEAVRSGLGMTVYFPKPDGC